MRNALFAVFLQLVGEATAAQCDCTIYPFKPDPPCVQQCSAKFLSMADYSSLVTVLKLSPEVAQGVAAIPLGQRPNELSAYTKFLPKTQVDALETRFKSLSPTEFQQLRRAVEKSGK